MVNEGESMSRDINKTILCGTLGRDPEFKDLDRTRLAKFSIATSDSYDSGTEHKEITTWHEIVVWGKLTDAVGLLRKGSRVLVEGKNSVRQFKDTNGTPRKAHEVIAISVTPLSSLGAAQPGLFGEEQPQRSTGRSRPAAERPAQSRIDAEPPPSISDDEIPF